MMARTMKNVFPEREPPTRQRYRYSGLANSASAGICPGLSLNLVLGLVLCDDERDRSAILSAHFNIGFFSPAHARLRPVDCALKDRLYFLSNLDLRAVWHRFPFGWSAGGLTEQRLHHLRVCLGHAGVKFFAKMLP